MVDADNAFNRLNRNVALHNIQFTCPSLATTIINIYRTPCELVMDDDVILSQEGTTQGDLLAMSFYALSVVPLMSRLTLAQQVWYADDACAYGSAEKVHKWWNDVNIHGPGFGYFPKASKSWLVVKESCYQSAVSSFAGSNVNITCEGRPYLGSPIGSDAYVLRFVEEKVKQWMDELQILSDIALAHPHAAYTAYIHGFKCKWSYLARTTPDVYQSFIPLEQFINSVFIPSITGQDPPSCHICSLLALPCRFGGLGISNPIESANLEYQLSVKVCGPLVGRISQQLSEYTYEIVQQQINAKTEVKAMRNQFIADSVSHVKQAISTDMLRNVDFASEKGASIWLTCLPIEEFGFSLHKRAFMDALALRYGWPVKNVPVPCSCGTSFTISHVLSCPKGGFPSLRHNEIRDVIACFLTEVCNDVQIEPNLQPVPQNVRFGTSANVTEGARLDISANGFWGSRYEKTFVDVIVFNPHSDTAQSTSISACYTRHEKEKKRQYECRVCEIEHSSFTPLVFSTTGGMSKQATIFYKRLASLLATKRDTS